MMERNMLHARTRVKCIYNFVVELEVKKFLESPTEYAKVVFISTLTK
jgi:hypothetical protein